MRNFADRLGEWIRDIINIFYFPFIKKVLPQETFLYAATGGSNLVLDTILYFLFYHFVIGKEIVDLGFIAISPHIAAFLMVLPITFSTGFLLAKYVTFTQSTLKGKKQFFRYGLSVVGSVVLNYILLKVFVEYFKFYPTPSKVLTTSIVVVYSFIIQKFFTFKTGKKQLAKA